MKNVLSRRQAGLSIILDEIYDPFNISAIFRTCDALGIKEVYIVNPPDGFKASKSVCMRCDKWLEVYKSHDRKEVYERVRKKGYKIYGTILNKESQDFREFNVNEPICIVLGNEHSGLCEESVSLCDELIYVPMYGFVQSFNVSVTAAIVLSNLVFRREASEKECYISK
ncbi:RNA methyltransferase, partial [bacterium]|nr:RNA methyltransferase [bacterium]